MPQPKTIEDYGSIKEWIRHEFLLPFLVIGGTEQVFWTQTPKTIKIYWEAEQKKRENEEQKMWLMGQYVKIAIESSVSNCAGMTDYKKFKLPQYPECPHLLKVEKVYSEEKLKLIEEARAKFLALGMLAKK